MKQKTSKTADMMLKMFSLLVFVLWGHYVTAKPKGNASKKLDFSWHDQSSQSDTCHQITETARTETEDNEGIQAEPGDPGKSRGR